MRWQTGIRIEKRASCSTLVICIIDSQLVCNREHAGRECERVIAVSTQFDYAQPFFEQVRELKERPTDPRTLPD